MKLRVIGTPKAIDNFQKKLSECEDVLKEKFKANNIELVFEATTLVYMNLQDPDYTVEQCDSMVYVMDESTINWGINEMRIVRKD